MCTKSRVAVCVFLSSFGQIVRSELPVPPTPKPAWIEQSDRNAQVFLDTQARFNPEDVTWLGMESADQRAIDLSPKREERLRSAYGQVISYLERQKKVEKDERVILDIDILLQSARLNIRESELAERYEVPYFDLSQIIYDGLRDLLDEQVSESRHQNALIRLKRYAGLSPGTTPVTQLAESRTRERLTIPGLEGPPRAQVEEELVTSDSLLQGVGQLFQDAHVAHYEAALARLKQEITEYNSFLRREILPKARSSFRLVPEIYAFRLRQAGVEVSAQQMAEQAHATFYRVQAEMNLLAPKVAREHGWSFTSYVDVIRELRKDQIRGDLVLPRFQLRLREINGIIEREHLVTLPEWPVRVRLATAAESVSIPSPFMRKPQFVGNTGQMGEFVLTRNDLRVADERAAKHMDDWTNDAISWTLCAHEARPGHELQFDSMIVHGTSIARGVLADTSVTTEGWGLYAEDILRPYMPIDGQLMSLQLELLRAARGFLDPELQLGMITIDQSSHVLTDEVGITDALARFEVERYTFRLPGQGPSYLYGLNTWRSLRREAETALGPRFNQERFHDFVLSQGLLPPDLMRKAVFRQFIEQQNKSIGGP